MKASISIIVVLLALSSVPILSADGQKPKPDTIPDPHHHAKGNDVLKEVAPEIRIVEARVPENAELQNLVLNKSLTFSSFTVIDEAGLERIFVRQILVPRRAEKVYEILGVAWPGRPLSDPVWAGNYFIFDRSTNPHAAIHYVFDMQKRVLVAARAFDE